MDDLNVLELRRRVRAVARGQLELEAFLVWLTPRAWTAYEADEEPFQSVAGAIDLALAEYDRGHISRTELEQRLHEIASSYSFASRDERLTDTQVSYSATGHTRSLALTPA